jgi:hypothetical protein
MQNNDVFYFIRGYAKGIDLPEQIRYDIAHTRADEG